jgi:8-oxo-dGTP pyrophosphatase MutT (NUDIX family)
MADLTPLPAATVTLVRDGAQGLEVLMMKRNMQSAFVPGRYLFPGGSVDPADGLADIYARCMGITDAAASSRLGLETGGLAYWVAAIRESFEESGLLLAHGEDGEPIAHEHAAELAQYRKAVAAGELPFDTLLRDAGLRLEVAALVYFAHWITPRGAPRRYDTRFFIAHAPVGQEPVHDNEEMTESVWISPREAVERHRAGTFKLMTPTIHTLRQFAEYETADALLAGMRAIPDVPTIAPRIGKDGRRLLPGEPGYDELAAG